MFNCKNCYFYNSRQKNNPNSCDQYIYHNAPKQTNTLKNKLSSP